MSIAVAPTILRNSFLFKEVSDDVLQQVAQHAQPMELAAGETLFKQDDPSDAMYFLAEGQIHIVRSYPDGYEVILATEVPDYVIGELSLLAGQPRTGSVVAVGNCDLVRLDRQAIVDVWTDHPELAVQALTHLGQRLYRLNLRIRESAVGNVGARVASVLLMLANQDVEAVKGLSVPRLARATAMDPDVVEHLLNTWTEQGIIDGAGQELRILDMNALKRTAG